MTVWWRIVFYANAISATLSAGKAAAEAPVMWGGTNIGACVAMGTALICVDAAVKGKPEPRKNRYRD